MTSVGGNNPFQRNSLDNIFSIKGSDDAVPDQMAINTGLLNKFGKDGAVTYLLTHIKDDKEVYVTRVGDHLIWTIGDQELNIGTSKWECVKHKVKWACSSSYRKNLGAKLGPKIDKIEKAYLRCLANEIAADVNMKDANTVDAEEQRVAQEQQAEQQRLVQEQKAQEVEQKAEEKRVAQEEKDQKIADFTNQIDSGEKDLTTLKGQLDTANSELDEQNNKLDALNVRKNAHETKASYQSKLNALKSVEDAFKGINLYADETEVNIVESAEALLGMKLVDDIKSYLPKLIDESQRNAKKKELNDAIDDLNDIEGDIATRTGLITNHENICKKLKSEIATKESEIEELRKGLQAEQDIEVESESEVEIEEPVVETEVIPDPIVEQTAEEKAVETLVQDMGLELDEAKFYVGLTDNEKELYDNLRYPADGAKTCSAYADFITSMLKGRNAVRSGNGTTSTITVDPGVVDMKLGGEPAKITLPATFSMTYAVDKQTWKINGKGFRIELVGNDVNLDGTQFEIRNNDLNIKVDPSKQSFAVKIGINLWYKNIPVTYDLVKQDALHSDEVV